MDFHRTFHALCSVAGIAFCLWNIVQLPRSGSPIPATILLALILCAEVIDDPELAPE